MMRSYRLVLAKAFLSLDAPVKNDDNFLQMGRMANGRSKWPACGYPFSFSLVTDSSLVN
jgi:di/tricarboxylate transporter